MLLELVFLAMGAVVLWCVIRSAVCGGVRDALKDVELWKRSLDD